MAHQREIHQLVGAKLARIGGAAAPIGHHRAAPDEAEHARHRHAVRAHGQNVGIVAECVEHRAEQRLREDGGAEVAHTRRIDAIMVAAFGRVDAGGNRQIAFERLAHLGALLARDGEQFGVVIGGEVAREARIDTLLAMPALALGLRTAAQFDRRNAERFRHLRRALRERRGSRGIVGQQAAIDREAAADERLTEKRRADMMQRQKPDQAGIGPTRGHKMATMPGRAGDCLAPGAAVKRRRPRMPGDIGVPRIGIGQRHRRLERRVHAAARHGCARSCCAGSSASARVHSKSASSFLSLPAMAARPV